MRIFDIMVPDGEYTDRQGEQKVSWNSIGFVMEKDNGKMSAKLYHMPGVWCSLFERNRDRNRGGNKGGNVEQIGGTKEPDW
jgi:hypothetical protein